MKFTSCIRYHLWITLAVVSVMLCTGTVAADELPSLFRGVTVGEGQPGVRVVFMKEDAFALAAGIRAGDYLVAIDGAPVDSLDDFAAVSNSLRGQQTDVMVTMVRGGTRVHAEISLLSPVVREAWGIVFIPDYSLRFVEPTAGHHYWSRRARQQLLRREHQEAMRSLLNVLHYAPDAYDEALALGETMVKQGRQLWDVGDTTAALGVMQQAVMFYDQASQKPLSSRQWTRVKRMLQELSDFVEDDA
jgi:membrane-associated protease RseP (regulator of RpoE activity)